MLSLSLSKKAFKKYLSEHAVRDKNSDFWTVTEPIKVFKKVYTYHTVDGQELSYHPHDTEMRLKNSCRKHCGKRNYGARAAIANLIIPAGARVHVDLESEGRKLRANQAIVHSVVRMEDKRQVAYAVSGRDPNFVYLNPEMMARDIRVTPANGFSHFEGTCSGGIHFYLELNSALNN